MIFSPFGCLAIFVLRSASENFMFEIVWSSAWNALWQSRQKPRQVTRVILPGIYPWRSSIFCEQVLFRFGHKYRKQTYIYIYIYIEDLSSRHTVIRLFRSLILSLLCWAFDCGASSLRQKCVGYEVSGVLGLVQTPNVSWAELNSRARRVVACPSIFVGDHTAKCHFLDKKKFLISRKYFLW